VRLDEEIGVTYRQLDWWTRQGYLHAREETGSGYSRSYTESEKNVARLMGRLVRVGFSAGFAGKVARAFLEGDRESKVVDLGEGIKIRILE